jgi:hypothetical protein
VRSATICLAVSILSSMVKIALASLLLELAVEAEYVGSCPFTEYTRNSEGLCASCGISPWYSSDHKCTCGPSASDWITKDQVVPCRPNSDGNEKAWVLDGCPKVGERKLDQEVDEFQIAPVRCCSDSMSCHSHEIGCMKQTYSDAKHTCANHGMRLCTYQEMKTNLCCGTGCNFDLELAWIARESYPQTRLEAVSGPCPFTKYSRNSEGLCASCAISPWYSSDNKCTCGTSVSDWITEDQVVPCTPNSGLEAVSGPCPFTKYTRNSGGLCASCAISPWYSSDNKCTCGPSASDWITKDQVVPCTPNSDGGKAWILDGCPKVGERKLDQEVDEIQIAPVRCCSDSMSCHSREIGCMKQTYSDAKRTCANQGMRLCTWQEMKTNLCCGTGCNFDLELTWILRESYPQTGLETVSETNFTAVV